MGNSAKNNNIEYLGYALLSTKKNEIKIRCMKCNRKATEYVEYENIYIKTKKEKNPNYYGPSLCLKCVSSIFNNFKVKYENIKFITIMLCGKLEYIDSAKCYKCELEKPNYYYITHYNNIDKIFYYICVNCGYELSEFHGIPRVEPEYTQPRGLRPIYIPTMMRNMYNK
jgi:hypothetical protein